MPTFIQKPLGWLLSPLAFSIGFLMPLLAQVIIALGLPLGGLDPYLAGGVVALAFGIMAQFRGSWLWIRQ